MANIEKNPKRGGAGRGQGRKKFYGNDPGKLRYFLLPTNEELREKAIAEINEVLEKYKVKS